MLAYLDQPGPSSVGGGAAAAASNATINKSIDAKCNNSNSSGSKEHSRSGNDINKTSRIKKAHEPSYKSPKKVPSKINNKLDSSSKKSPKHCTQPSKLPTQPSEHTDQAAGAVPTLVNSSNTNSPKKTKKTKDQSSHQVSIASSKSKELHTQPSCCNSIKTLPTDTSTIALGIENLALPSKSVSMDDSKSPAADDFISKLCSKLAEIGAVKPSASDIAAVKVLMMGAPTTKTPSPDLVLSDPISREEKLEVNKPSNIRQVNGTSSVSPTQTVTVNGGVPLNTSEQMSPEELAAERKARKEAKKAKKVNPTAVSSETTKSNESTKNDSEANKENIPKDQIPSKQSSDSFLLPEAPQTQLQQQQQQAEKTKADLKRERRAIQEAQRAAKEQAQKEAAAKKATAAAASASANDAKKASGASLRPEAKKVKSSIASSGSGPRVASRRSAAKSQSAMGFSSLPFVRHLKVPNHVVEEPKYINNVTPAFVTLTQEIYLGELVDNNEKFIGFLNALFVFIEDFYASPGTDIQRHMIAKLHVNIAYMEHYNTYTPPMANLLSLFHAMLHVIAEELRKSFGKGAAITVPEVEEEMDTEDQEDVEADLGPSALYSPEERAHQLAWGEALHEQLVELREWLLAFAHKTFEQNTLNLMGRMTRFFDDDDHILIFGFSKLVVGGIQRACEEDGRSLSLLVLETRLNGRDQDMAAELEKLQLNRGRVRRVAFSDLCTVMPKVQKVLLCCNYVSVEGSSQGPAGHAQVVRAANKMLVPVLGVCYSFQFIGLGCKQNLRENVLCDPSECLWGRRPQTRRVTLSKSKRRFISNPLPPARTSHFLASNLKRNGLLSTLSERFLVHGSPCSTGDTHPSTSSETITAHLNHPPPHALASNDARLAGSSYSVGNDGANFWCPRMASNVPVCCLKYDYAPGTIAYIINDLYCLPPKCAPSVANRLDRLL